MNYDEMPAGRDMDALISEFMEPKPKAEKTYAQLRQETDPGYSLWTVMSPNRWWQIVVCWGEVKENNSYFEIPDWEPAEEPSKYIRAAWEVVEKLNISLINSEDGWYAVQTEDVIHWEQKALISKELRGQYWALAETAPLAICRAALKAMGVNVNGEES